MTSGLAAEMRALMEEVRSLREAVHRDLPTILTREAAAREMSISLTTLKGMIRRGEIATCTVGKRDSMVPSSEVLRVAGSLKRSSAPKLRTSGGRPKTVAVSPKDVAAKVREALKAERKR